MRSSVRALAAGWRRLSTASRLRILLVLLAAGSVALRDALLFVTSVALLLLVPALGVARRRPVATP